MKVRIEDLEIARVNREMVYGFTKSTWHLSKGFVRTWCEDWWAICGITAIVLEFIESYPWEVILRGVVVCEWAGNFQP